MRILFMGTPDFAMPTLKVLAKDKEINILGVFTQPDRIKGRGQRLQAPPVKAIANSLKLKIFQPVKLCTEDIDSILSELKPEAIVVVAYGHILPGWMLSSIPIGCINLHASLLPLYRGAAPINWAIINGEKETGVTTMLMDEGMDTGPILLQGKTPINSSDTAGTLHDRLSVLGANLMLRTLKGLARNEITPIKQPEDGATFAPKLDKETGRLNWENDNISICNKIRGLNPTPGAFTFLNNQLLKIWDARPVMKIDIDKDGVQGEILAVDDEFGLIVKAGRGAVGILEIQPENKKRMPIMAFINGCRIDPIGQKFNMFR